jgi:hypothetical protein
MPTARQPGSVGTWHRPLPSAEEGTVEMDYTENHDCIDGLGLLTCKQEAA